MKGTTLFVFWIAGLGACGVAEPEGIGEATEALTYPNNIFYDKFDSYAVGSINGQGGWVGTCAAAAATAPDKNLRCTGGPGLTNGRGAMNTFIRPLNRNYHLQFDVWTEGVVDSTHGKVFLEAPPGDGTNSILQIAIGCDNIRATFEYHANTTQGLLSFPCSNGPHYRVACIWADHGNAFRCGAAVSPADPVEASFITIPAIDQNGAPEAIGAFDRVRVLGGIGERTGTTVFDKIQVLSD
jgi:hypothetical protein